MTRIIRALFHSLAGFKAAFRDEAAFREEVILAAIMIPLACILAADATQLILMVSSVLLVLIVELINTAIEAAIDHTSKEQHPFAKKAKDCASASVLIALILTGVVWAVCLLQIKQ